MSTANRYFTKRLLNLFGQSLTVMALAAIVMTAFDAYTSTSMEDLMGYSTVTIVIVVSLFFTVVSFGVMHYYRFALQNNLHRRTIAHHTLIMQLACTLFLTVLFVVVQQLAQHLMHLSPPAVSYPVFVGFLFLFIINMFIGFEVALLIQQRIPQGMLFPGFRILVSTFLFINWFILYNAIINVFLNSTLIFRENFFDRAFNFTAIGLVIHLILFTFLQYHLIHRHQHISQ